MLAALLSGHISRYDPGVFERVIKTRQSGRTSHDLPLILPETDGYAATLSADLIGKVVWLRPKGLHHWYSFLVVDCGGGADGGAAWMRRNNILAEIDPATYYEWRDLGWRRDAEMSLRGLVRTRFDLD